jgi:hypothetical protein
MFGAIALIDPNLIVSEESELLRDEVLGVL